MDEYKIVAILTVIASIVSIIVSVSVIKFVERKK